MSWPTHIVAAGGYVFDKCGNILIVKTKNRGWDCTGGQIEVALVYELFYKNKLAKGF